MKFNLLVTTFLVLCGTLEQGNAVVSLGKQGSLMLCNPRAQCKNVSSWLSKVKKELLATGPTLVV
jgi:hypothetical protein